MSISKPVLSKKFDQVSNFFIKKAAEDKTAITNKKVQKLAYYSQAWHLVFFDGKSLYDDPIEAWMHGPAIRALWHKYRKYGYSPIADTPAQTSLDEKTTDLLNEVWNVYGKYDAGYLEALTHSEAPWLEARKGLEVDETSAIVISNDSMRHYYSSLNAA